MDLGSAGPAGAGDDYSAHIGAYGELSKLVPTPFRSQHLPSTRYSRVPEAPNTVPSTLCIGSHGKDVVSGLQMNTMLNIRRLSGLGPKVFTLDLSGICPARPRLVLRGCVRDCLPLARDWVDIPRATECQGLSSIMVSHVVLALSGQARCVCAWFDRLRHVARGLRPNGLLPSSSLMRILDFSFDRGTENVTKWH